MIAMPLDGILFALTAQSEPGCLAQRMSEPRRGAQRAAYPPSARSIRARADEVRALECANEAARRCRSAPSATTGGAIETVVR